MLLWKIEIYLFADWKNLFVIRFKAIYYCNKLHKVEQYKTSGTSFM